MMYMYCSIKGHDTGVTQSQMESDLLKSLYCSTYLSVFEIQNWNVIVLF